MKYLLISLIKIYQSLISPFMQRISLIGPSACRFNPTCSVYTIQAIEKYGSLMGIKMGVKRVLSCNALNHKNHFDPISLN